MCMHDIDYAYNLEIMHAHCLVCMLIFCASSAQRSGVSKPNLQRERKRLAVPIARSAPPRELPPDRRLDGRPTIAARSRMTRVGRVDLDASRDGQTLREPAGSPPTTSFAGDGDAGAWRGKVGRRCSNSWRLAGIASGTRALFYCGRRRPSLRRRLRTDARSPRLSQCVAHALTARADPHLRRLARQGSGLAMSTTIKPIWRPSGRVQPLKADSLCATTSGRRDAPDGSRVRRNGRAIA